MYLMNSIQLCIVSFIVFQHYHVERGFVSDIKWYLYIEPDVASHTGYVTTYTSFVLSTE